MKYIKSTKDFIANVSFDTLFKHLDKSNEDLAILFNTTPAIIKNSMIHYNMKRTKEQSNNIRKQTCLKKYGVDNIFKDTIKIKKAMIAKYGVTHNSYLESTKQKRVDTYFDKTGYKYNSQNPESNRKKLITILNRYGVSNVSKSSEIKHKIKQTKKERYGDENYVNIDKITETCQSRYNVKWSCQLAICKKHSSSNSKPNKIFAEKLDAFNIKYDREYPLYDYTYDFKINNFLIEINPSATHNSNNFIGHGSLDKYYHQMKSKIAYMNGFYCVHIFDWINPDDIIKALLSDKLSLSDKFIEPKCWAYNTKTKTKKLYDNKETDKYTALIWDSGQDLLIDDIIC